MKRTLAAFLAVLFISTQAQAQIVVDGVRDEEGYRLVATQTCNTQFGDNENELNAMYVAFEDSRMFVLLTGNINLDFTKLEVFFDTVEGGENVLSSIPEYDFCCVNAGGVDYWNTQFFGGPVSMGPGLTLDPDFEVDYHMFYRAGFTEGSDKFDGSFANRMGGGSAMIPWNDKRTEYDFMTKTASGTITPADVGSNASGSALMNDVDFAIDNNNEAGVIGFDPENPVPADQEAAEAVTTGIEFSIDVADLGIDPESSGCIKIMPFYNNSDHRYVSNQALAGFPFDTANLGGDNMGGFIEDLGFASFAAFDGDQFVRIAYCPGAILGDVSGDGKVTFLDIQPFVDLLNMPGSYQCEADINQDCVVDFLDIEGFVGLLGGP